MKKAYEFILQRGIITVRILPSLKSYLIPQKTKNFNHMKRILLMPMFVLLIFFSHAQNYILNSPDLKSTVKVSVTKSIQYSVTHNATELIAPGLLSTVRVK